MSNLLSEHPDVHRESRENLLKPTLPLPLRSLKVYVATSFVDAPVARDLHARARAIGIEPVSSWAEDAAGAENLNALPRDVVRRIARTNDLDLHSAHLVAALARDGVGAEMFAEVRLALAYRIPVLWIGTRRPLSAYREGVLRVENVGEAMVHLCGLAQIVRDLPAREKRRTAEVLWDVIESLQADEAA